MKITYREENGCFYPNLKLPEQSNYTMQIAIETLTE